MEFVLTSFCFSALFVLLGTHWTALSLPGQFKTHCYFTKRKLHKPQPMLLVCAFPISSPVKISVEAFTPLPKRIRIAVPTICPWGVSSNATLEGSVFLGFGQLLQHRQRLAIHTANRSRSSSPNHNHSHSQVPERRLQRSETCWK